EKVLSRQRIDARGAAVIARCAAAAHVVTRLDAAPRVAEVVRDAEAVGSRDVDAVAAHCDAVRCDVLPLGAELIERPVAPGRAAVDGDTEAVADRAIPDGVLAHERDAVDEAPRYAAVALCDVAPLLRLRLPDEDALAERADPRRAQRRALDREHVYAPAVRVRQWCRRSEVRDGARRRPRRCSAAADGGGGKRDDGCARDQMNKVRSVYWAHWVGVSHTRA